MMSYKVAFLSKCLWIFNCL